MPAPAFSLSLQGDSELAEALERKIAPPEKLADAAARGVSNLVVDHLLARNASASHREGFPRSGYWADAADDVKVKLNGCVASIVVHAQGLRLHRYGGTVFPKEAKSLAIPARAEVAGVRPKEYDPSRSKHFLWWPKNRTAGALARREGSGHLTILWWLVGATHHEADPTVLPPEADMRAAATAAAKEALGAYRAGRSA